MFTRILVPTDFSEPSDAALSYAQQLATRFGASLHLLHVIDDPVVTGMFSPATSVEAVHPESGLPVRHHGAEQQMQARRAMAHRSGLRTTIGILSGACVPTILTAAQHFGADLIVMGTHGRTGVAHALMGSVAERIVRTAPCPVLTVHAAPLHVMDTVACDFSAAFAA